MRFLPEAEVELDAAVAYYEEQAEGLGRAFALAVQQGLGRITERPHAWQALSRRIRRYRLPGFPYGLVYAPLAVIVAVMHLHRHPDYWRERLKAF
jgi:hypothetical protein